MTVPGERAAEQRPAAKPLREAHRRYRPATTLPVMPFITSRAFNPIG